MGIFNRKIKQPKYTIGTRILYQFHVPYDSMGLMTIPERFPGTVVGFNNDTFNIKLDNGKYVGASEWEVSLLELDI